MTHSQFVNHYRSGGIRVDFDRKGAARYLSARLMLPLFMLPVLGAGVALALVGWVWAGLAVIAIGIIAPRLIKRSAPTFLMTQALEDESVFSELYRSGVLRVTDVNSDARETAK